MTSRQQAASTAAATTSPAPLPEWMAEAAAQGVKPEQALAFIGLGLMQKMAGSGNDLPWIWADSDDGGRADLAALRQRLELTQLALQTGAPLTTAEVSQLLGVRPTSESVERAGIRARRLSRNVWKLARAEGGDSRSDDAFRRRF
ncbi:hypothetical protein [Synechococcus sp. CBW1108]|uniref:hypothetical protein n=1 Tax=Synechococcus sp. CBW1108 TaxID=1353147 RepID=UPI00351C8F7F